MKYICIGKIVDTHGIKGELRIRSDFEKKDRVFKENFNFYIGDEKQKEVINSYRVHKNFDMVTFKGYRNINEVLKYLKKNVYVDRNDLNLSNDEYLLSDLIGFNVIDSDENIGKVVDFVYNSSNILLVIKGIKGFYIPYKSDYISRIDLDNGEIITNNGKDLIL